MTRLLAVVVALPPLLAACGGPTVNLSTARPLEVDVTLRVDIYQHGGPAEPAADAATGTPEERRRARMAQIQTLKNARLVGENRRGLLSVVEPPTGEYGDYVRRTVEAENADRTALMRTLAAERRQPLATIEAEEAKLWRERAFPGEWIEAEQPDGEWRWSQKATRDPVSGRGGAERETSRGSGEGRAAPGEAGAAISPER
jgi:hypothetical protein